MAILGARARRVKARAPRFMSKRLASKRHCLGARPSPGAGRFGRAPSRDFPDFPNPNTRDFVVEISSLLSLLSAATATVVARRYYRYSSLPQSLLALLSSLLLSLAAPAVAHSSRSLSHSCCRRRSPLPLPLQLRLSPATAVVASAASYFLPRNKQTLITISNDKDLQRMVDFHADSDTTDIFVTKKVESRQTIMYAS
ncbi:hypothetical protein C4D60_Mb03t19150 [Musa balbisiana]|uniref:PB1 domain-containing protein n=1 Tax=Musa balbisiana TaxID=52838 RepID=A0A4S8JB15_MUSBA|nr:hypothetical protein C4D60_Mb03t19150 [Musa balbisiana]